MKAESLSSYERIDRNAERMDTPLNQGGMQIEYEDEDPEIRRLFEEECARSEAEVKMPKVV